MKLGLWWLEAAARGVPAELPVINLEPLYDDAPDPSGGKRTTKAAPTPAALSAGKAAAARDGRRGSAAAPVGRPFSKDLNAGVRGGGLNAVAASYRDLGGMA